MHMQIFIEWFYHVILTGNDFVLPQNRQIYKSARLQSEPIRCDCCNLEFISRFVIIIVIITSRSDRGTLSNKFDIQNVKELPKSSRKLLLNWIDNYSQFAK
jgi:hypothetical protein